MVRSSIHKGKELRICYTSVLSMMKRFMSCYDMVLIANHNWHRVMALLTIVQCCLARVVIVRSSLSHVLCATRQYTFCILLLVFVSFLTHIQYHQMSVFDWPYLVLSPLNENSQRSIFIFKFALKSIFDPILIEITYLKTCVWHFTWIFQCYASILYTVVSFSMFISL